MAVARGAAASLGGLDDPQVDHHHPSRVVTCDVCGRTLLRGEKADVFLAGGTRRMVCELCTRVPMHEGWIREGLADAPSATAHGARTRGSSLAACASDVAPELPQLDDEPAADDAAASRSRPSPASAAPPPPAPPPGARGARVRAAAGAAPRPRGPHATPT